MKMVLSRVEIGLRCVITEVKAKGPLRCRLYQMGLVPGTKLSVCYRSPEGGVTVLDLDGTVIALRTRELRKVRIRLCSE